MQGVPTGHLVIHHYAEDNSFHFECMSVLCNHMSQHMTLVEQQALALCVAICLSVNTYACQ